MKQIVLTVILSLIIACSDRRDNIYKYWTALKMDLVQQNTDSLAHIKKIAQKQWGNGYQLVQHVESESFEQIFRNKQIYYVGYNKVTTSGFRPNYRVILTDKKTTDFIETDNDALTAISQQKIFIQTTDQAFLLINAFADLRNYRLINMDNVRNEIDYSQKISKMYDFWIISLVFQVNLSFYKMVRYTFKINNSGFISIISTKVIDAHPGGK